MKNPANTKAIINATLCLLIICFVITFAVAGTNAVFEERIAEQEASAIQESMSKLIEADEYELFTAEDDSDAYKALSSSGEVLGYVFTTAAKGYGSSISVMTAISDDQVVAISILSCDDETPGLGQNITNESFTDQFAGLTAAPEVIKSGTAGENEIQALTGATKSSRGVTDAVTAAFALYEAAEQ